MEDALQFLESANAPRAFVYCEPSCGLRAFLVIDDLTLGAAAGGIRTQPYPRPLLALADATRLARAMTLKCSIAGVDAGGGKMVVVDHAGLDRERAFRVLGERVQELGGMFITAGDAGTRRQDLQAMAKRTRYVHVDDGDLSGAVASGLMNCLQACVDVAGRGDVGGLSVAVQGCGAIGGAVARRLAAAGARLMVADVDPRAARAVADETGAEVLDAAEILTAEVDILAPCALGGVIDEDVASKIRAWAVCGAANNILAGAAAGDVLQRRDVLFVPDILASAGAVIRGVSDEHGDGRAEQLIAALGDSTRDVLRESMASGVPTTQVAHERAAMRIRRSRC